MYNESSGEMYDAYETKKANDARKRRLLIRRIVTVSILVLILIYFIILLIDIRHNPSENDIMMFNYIRSIGAPHIVIANKADKIAVTKVPDVANKLQKTLNPIGDIPTFPFSSERKIYMDDVWNEIEKYI